MALKFTLLTMAQAWAKPSQARIPGFGSGMGFLKPGLSHGEGSYEVISEGVEDLIEAKASLRNAKPEVWAYPWAVLWHAQHSAKIRIFNISDSADSSNLICSPGIRLKYQYFVYITCSKGLGDLSTSQTLQTCKKTIDQTIACLPPIAINANQKIKAKPRDYNPKFDL
ncbi:hypothetical protein B0H10DRAFT_1970471 [Mycena sp. CBHHK59/15]|nr:hypothetical protein B0H10DRAFT_1970471 [Mycena sp. CBHHK59/15]